MQLAACLLASIKLPPPLRKPAAHFQAPRWFQHPSSSSRQLHACGGTLWNPRWTHQGSRCPRGIPGRAPGGGRLSLQAGWVMQTQGGSIGRYNQRWAVGRGDAEATNGTRQLSYSLIAHLGSVSTVIAGLQAKVLRMGSAGGQTVLLFCLQTEYYPVRRLPVNRSACVAGNSQPVVGPCFSLQELSFYSWNCQNSPHTGMLAPR